MTNLLVNGRVVRGRVANGARLATWDDAARRVARVRRVARFRVETNQT